MKKRQFLLPLAITLAALGTPLPAQAVERLIVNLQYEQKVQPAASSFVIKPATRNIQKVQWDGGHASHSSHASHASHSSHYSSRY